MKSAIYIIIIFAITLISCKKDSFTGSNQPETRENFIFSGEKGPGIYYHDINPDWEKHGFGLFNDSLNIDLNADGIPDVSIKYTTFLSGTEYDQQTSVSCLNGARISLAPKNQGDTIGYNSSWTTTASVLCYTKIDFATSDTAYTGVWKDTHDKYLAVKIIKNNRVLFGWIRMSLLVPPEIVYIQQIIVKDYAWKEI